MNKLFFRRLHLLVQHETETFQNQLQRLQASDYPSDSGPAFIREILLELGRRQKAVTTIESEYEADPRGAGERLQSEHRKIIFLFRDCIAGIENAQSRRVPWEIIPAFERLAAVLSPGRSLLVSCVEEFNYRIAWHESEAKGLESFIRLQIPRIHRNDALLHVLVGHELFHPVLNKFLKREQPKVIDRLRIACEMIPPPDPTDPLFEADRLDKWVELARKAWVSAMSEMMCDMGCVALFGPAAILSSWSIALGRSLDQLPSSPAFYPPWRYRIRSMLRYGFEKDPGKTAFEQMEKSLKGEKELAGFAESFRKYFDEIKREVAPLEDKTPPDIEATESKLFLKLAYDEVSSSLDAAWEYVQDIVTRERISWTDSYEQIPPLVQLISRSVPPSEARESNQYDGPAADLSPALVAAWLTALNKEITDYSDAGDGRSYYERYSRLLLKALADIEVKREYKK